MATDSIDQVAEPLKPVPPVVMSQERGKVKHLFICNEYPSCIFIFPNGKPAPFVNHQFMTDVLSEIEFLTEETKRPGSSISIDASRPTVEVFEDPIAALRAKMFEEFKTEQAKVAAGTTNLGKYEGDKNLNMANSSTIREMAAGSSGGATLTPVPAAHHIVPNIKVK